MFKLLWIYCSRKVLSVFVAINKTVTNSNSLWLINVLWMHNWKWKSRYVFIRLNYDMYESVSFCREHLDSDIIDTLLQWDFWSLCQIFVKIRVYFKDSMTSLRLVLMLLPYQNYYLCPSRDTSFCWNSNQIMSISMEAWFSFHFYLPLFVLTFLKKAKD